jgi:hypothetical protein
MNNHAFVTRAAAEIPKLELLAFEDWGLPARHPDLICRISEQLGLSLWQLLPADSLALPLT